MSISRLMRKLSTGKKSASLTAPLCAQEMDEIQVLKPDAAQQNLIKSEIANLPKKRMEVYEAAQFDKLPAAYDALKNLQQELTAINQERYGRKITKNFLNFVENAKGYANTVEEYVKVLNEYLKITPKKPLTDRDIFIKDTYAACKITLDSHIAIYTLYKNAVSLENTRVEKSTLPATSKMSI